MVMNQVEQRKATKAFAAFWQGKGEFRQPVTQLLEGLDFFTDLVKAHDANEKAVNAAYGFAPDADEPAMVAELLHRYQAKVQEGELKLQEAAKAKVRKRQSKKPITEGWCCPGKAFLALMNRNRQAWHLPQAGRCWSFTVCSGSNRSSGWWWQVSCSSGQQ